MAASDTIEAEGHLIDSGLLSAIFDKIIEFKASYEILTFNIGRTNDDPSRIEMRINAAEAVILAGDGRAVCRKLRDVRAGEPVVCGHEGIRVTPEFKERDRLGFAFMSNDVSSERRVEGVVSKIADMMRQVKKSGGRIAVVGGPVVVHTGGVEHFSELIRLGYVD